MHLEVAASAHYRVVLERLLASRLFAEAPIQRKLLAYLGEKSLGGSVAELKEYTIGVELFAKPKSYSPQADPSVRVQASRLRLKMDEYYRTEGQDSDVLIRLPKGSFTLLFEPRTAPEQAPLTYDSSPRNVAPLPSAHPLRRWLVTAAIILLSALAVREFAVIRDLQGQLWQKNLDPALMALWRPLLASPRPLLLVLGTPLFFSLEGGCYRNSTLNSAADAQDSPLFKGLLQKAEPALQGSCSSYTGVGESVGMFLLGQVFFEAGKKVSVQRSRSLAWDAIQSHDLVVLGSTKSNQQMKDLPVPTKYKLEPGGIRVLHPSTGEPSLYQHTLSSASEVLTDYTLISRLPGLEANSFILFIGSESTAGNWAGAQYLTTPSYAKDLTSRLADSAGHIPNYFEVVIKSDFQSDHPVKIDYIAHHVIAAR